MGGDVAADLAAGAEATVAVKVPMEMTDERIRQLNDEDLLYFHYGKGTYEDDSGHVYPVEFCFMYTPLAPLLCEPAQLDIGHRKTVETKTSLTHKSDF